MIASVRTGIERVENVCECWFGEISDVGWLDYKSECHKIESSIRRAVR